MRTDQDIGTECLERLHGRAELDDLDIAIKVVDGVVLLAGIVRSTLERAQAEQTVKKIAGVAGLSNCLTVCPHNAAVPADPEITREAVALIRHQFPEQVGSVQVLTRDGRVALEGELEWYHQRDVIEAMVRAVRGVTLIANKIRVGSRKASPVVNP